MRLLRCEGIDRLELLLCTSPTTDDSAGIDLLLEEIDAKAAVIPPGNFTPHIRQALGGQLIPSGQGVGAQLLGDVQLQFDRNGVQLHAGDKKIVKNRQELWYNRAGPKRLGCCFGQRRLAAAGQTGNDPGVDAGAAACAAGQAVRFGKERAGVCMIFKEESQLMQNIKLGHLYRVYLLYGEEKYLKEMYLKKLVKLAAPQGLEEFNLHRFDAGQMEVDDLIESCEALPDDGAAAVRGGGKVRL